MQWLFIYVLILTTTTAVLSSPRQKRHLSYIKDLITKTLFGEDLVILQQPKIPKNEPFKLFKVEGHDNTLLKVIRKLKKQAVVAENVKDPVIVKPEIAIIGNYLGTTTQRETLLAIEMVRDLLRSGILNENHDKLIRKVSFPIPAQLPLASCVHEPLVITEETHPMYLPPIVNKPVPIAVHIPSLVSPIQTKYAYEQKGYDADMKYQSYNNQDVIVTRINKEPVLPDVIKMRLSDVASIGTHTFNSRAHVIEMPKPYSQHSIKEPQYSVPNHSGLLVPTNTNFNENETRVNSLSNQNDFVINKFTEAEKDKVNQPADKKTAQASPLSVKQENSNQNATPEGNNKDGVTKKSEWNGEFVRKYIYKQNTNNKLGESPKLTSNSDNIKTNENHDISSDFMYVPPQNADVPLPNSVLKTNNLRSNERGDISEDRENEYYSNVNSDEKSIPRKSIISDYSLTNPIVVEEPAGKKFHYIDGSIF